MSGPETRRRRRGQILAAIAGVFGLVTITAASGVLFGPEPARTLAGDIVPFVVWFNFFAGFAYLAAAVGLWRIRPWGHKLALAIAVATAGAAVIFTVVAATGTPVEPRTGGALALRLAVWGTIAWFASPRGNT